MWMAAGFAMLEAGMVRSKSVAMQCTKNIALYSIAGIAFWVLGYNLMYDGVDGGFLEASQLLVFQTHQLIQETTLLLQTGFSKWYSAQQQLP